ncbi:TIGR02530 family flagellar biosynthesis protein [Paenibacillus sediminis]|uniref:Flagellar operon protein n=1 Tax=Paenibacillus sediminis TaxID=664909 RepID=A0ABS4H1L2_9BACL|nr:TIGR02530 family flagellar biosynthesis protein [Paenibacillus sediminis]MBP1936420.1 flagellar operon protein [Paenibacillus sediminis]
MNERLTVGQLFPGKIPSSMLRPKTQSASSEKTDSTFRHVLDEYVVKFSNHAAKRLEQRGLQLEPEQLSKIESAIDKAAAKGAKESLILMKDMALIVNVQKRTVVTAMDGDTMKDNIFTQIDSAVIIA